MNAHSFNGHLPLAKYFPWLWHQSISIAFSILQHTPLNAPGIYIRTLIPDGPAASDGRLRIGDRILAVNGTSLIGADYQR